MARLVKCPKCGQQSPYDPSNPFRPFCSERCKMIDLGKWMQEEYSVRAVGEEDGDQEPKESP
jgi:uncharacterized protein